MGKLSKISSIELLQQEALLEMSSFGVTEALEVGDFANVLGTKRNLPVAIEVRIGDWVIYHASLPGSSPQNQEWLDRKARVVSLKHHSTLYERVSSEERGVDWYKENNLTEELYAIHGGGLPIIVKNYGLAGTLLVSGLPQLDDHKFGVDVLRLYIDQGGK